MIKQIGRSMIDHSYLPPLPPVFPRMCHQVSGYMLHYIIIILHYITFHCNECILIIIPHCTTLPQKEIVFSPYICSTYAEIDIAERTH